jgi:hypothetical protein
MAASGKYTISIYAIGKYQEFKPRQNNLQRIWNLLDNFNKSVLAYAEWFYVNFKIADVWNWIPERSVGRLKEDLSIDTTFDPP